MLKLLFLFSKAEHFPGWRDDIAVSISGGAQLGFLLGRKQALEHVAPLVAWWVTLASYISAIFLLG